jgi:photosystem II stability/assembly factor-like uncharacterized protein
MRRAWWLLAVASVALCAAACGTQAPGEARRSPTPGAAADHAAGPTARQTAGSTAGQAAGHAVAPTGSPLSGAFLIDLTWISDQRGWALAAAPCATGLCPRLASTRNGGHTWQALPDPPVHIPYGTPDCPQAACVSHLRFATPAVGYLFGPALYQTSDGGRTWQPVPSRPVESLEPSAGTVVRVVYDHGGCPGPCDRLVQETTAGSGTWHTLLRIPAASAGYSPVGQLVRQGTAVMYLPLYGHLAGGAGSAHALILSTADAGQTWQQRPDPCGGTGANEHDAIDMAAAPGGFAAVLCAPRSGTGSTFVVTSADGGASWSLPRLIPGGTRHYLALIAAASPANLVVGTAVACGQGLFPYRLVTSTDGGRHWSTEVTGTTQISPEWPGPSFLGFEDAGVGRWISGAHDIWTTRDAGRRWRELPFP